MFIRKAITPLREVLLAVQRSENPLIQERTLPYFRDVFDHTLRVIDTMDSYRDLINGLLDIYLSSVSNRMNEVMKVLTVFATIFIPLTFLVGGVWDEFRIYAGVALEMVLPDPVGILFPDSGRPS